MKLLHAIAYLSNRHTEEFESPRSKKRKEYRFPVDYRKKPHHESRYPLFD